MISDLRQALRTLAKSPAYSAVAILTLALGIGANTAIFSVLYGVLLAPLPYSEPERLVSVSVYHAPSQRRSAVVPPEYTTWARQARLLSSVAAYRLAEYNITSPGEPDLLEAAHVTASFLPLLGVQPAHGRTFLHEEDRPGGPPAVILGHALWQARFSADPAVLGSAVSLDGRPYSVVGVLPAAFRFPDDARVDLLLPLTLPLEPNWKAEGYHALPVLGRMKPGVSPEQIRAEIAGIRRALLPQLPPLFAWGVAQSDVLVVPLQERLVGKVRPLILVLGGAVAFVLLIACANVAHLGLARAAERQREMGVRAVLGAGTWRLIRQLLIESALLTLLGAAAGLAVAAVALRLVRTFGSPAIPAIQLAVLNGPVLLFALAVAGSSVILFGLAPALAGTRLGLTDVLGSRTMQATGGRTHHILRSVFVGTEVALALMLLVGAGLLMRSYAALAAVAPGVRPENVVTARLKLPLNAHLGAPQRAAFLREVEARLRALPGVISVGTAGHLPLDGEISMLSLRIDGHTLPPNTMVAFDSATPDYFRALGVPLIAGRYLDWRDATAAAEPLIVNEAFVRRYLHGEDPLRVQLWGSRAAIVGVVGDARQLGLNREAVPQMWMTAERRGLAHLSIALRVGSDPRAVIPEIRRVIASVNRNVPVYDVATMARRVTGSIAAQRFQMGVLVAFAGLALGLAAVGVYGVMAYLASLRTREIGVRVALGASRAQVLRMVVRQGMVAVLVGAGAGAIGALALTRVLASLLFRVRPTDPATFLGALSVLTVLAALACYLPARRAAKVDPMVALRCE